LPTYGGSPDQKDYSIHPSPDWVGDSCRNRYQDGRTNHLPLTLPKNYPDISGSLQERAKTVVILQNQIDFLEAVTLQNRRGVDLLTAEKVGFVFS
jgi:hypothetical protein